MVKNDPKLDGVRRRRRLLLDHFREDDHRCVMLNTVWQRTRARGINA